MKILIATGIFPPEAGGPATYAVNLASLLVERGNEVKVITFVDQEISLDKYNFEVVAVKREGKLRNFLNMKKVLMNEIPDYDAVYSLDWFTVGFPLALVCRKLQKKYILRVGGGYIWEKYLRSEKGPMTLEQFYSKNLYQNFPILFHIIRFVFRNAEKVIFNTEKQKTLFEKYYKFKSTDVIWNPLPEQFKGLHRSGANNEIVFAGRLIAMKNVEALIEGYQKSGVSEKLVIIGDGPSKKSLQTRFSNLEIEFLPTMSQEDLYRRIIDSKVVVIPSWTDISPNQVYELISLKIPFLLTKENYLPIHKQIPLMIDPGDSGDLAEKFRYLSDRNNYNSFVEDLSKIEYTNSWSDVVDEHQKLFQSVI